MVGELAQFAARSLGLDLNEICDKADVRDLENRRLAVSVDSDDGAGNLGVGQILDGAQDADGDTEVGDDELVGLSDVQLVGRTVSIDGRARSAGRSAELVREAVEDLEGIGAASGAQPARVLAVRRAWGRDAGAVS